MPRRPSFLDETISQPVFQPHVSFVGRADVLAKFHELQEKPQTLDDYRILNIYGIGGQGKTALSRQFLKQLQAMRDENGKHIAFASLNFEVETYRRDSSLALLSLRHQLRKQGIIFPAFDTAFGRYFTLTQQGRDIEKVHPELFYQPNEILSDAEGAAGDILGSIGGMVGDLVGDIPGVGSILKNTGKLSSKLKRWWERRGKQVLVGLDQLEPYDITVKLPTYFAADVYDWLSDEHHSKRRLTLVLDTYEALWRERPTKVGTLAIQVDDWVQRLVNDVAGAFVVILGCDALTWADHDSSWQQYIHEWRLDELEAAEAETLLLDVPIPESDIRAAILTSTERVAFYLKLQIDRYADLKNRNSVPIPADFTQAQDQIVARFADHLDAGLAQVLKVVSCPRFVDESLFLKLAKTFLGGAASVSFHDLLHYSFWEEPEAVAEGQAVRYRLHNVMRIQLQAILKRDEPALFAELHQSLFKLYDGVFQRVADIEQTVMDEHGINNPYSDWQRYQKLLQPHETERQALFAQFDDALTEGLYHLEQFDVGLLPTWLADRQQTHRTLAQWETLQPLWFHTLMLTEQTHGEKHTDTALCLSNLAGVYSSQGRYGEAEPLYQRVLEISEKVLGAFHPNTALSLNNLAFLYSSRGCYVEAEPLYQRALVIYKEVLGAAHPNTTRSLNNLAELYRSQGRYMEAEPLFLRTLAIREEVLGVAHPDTAISLNNLALLYHSQGRYVDAEPLYQRSLAILEDVLGASHPETANILSNMAGLYHAQDRYTEAERLFLRALAIREKVLGVVHPDTASNLNNLAALYRSQGRYAEAEPLLQRSLTICEEVLGVTHPNTTASLNNLALLYRSQGCYAEAEPLYQRALQVLEVSLGKEHHTTRTVRNNYEICQQQAKPPITLSANRNALCSCGSGKRYKRCHGKLD